MYRPQTKLTLLLPLLLAVGCKNPFDRTKDESGGGALNAFGSGSFVVFSNELKTGGGAFLYPGPENQNLSFNDTSNPISARSIRYTWNGGDVSSQFGLIHTFAGFDLMHVPTQATYASTVGRDLQAAGYTKVTFYARGSLSASTLIKIEVSDDGDGGATPPCLSLSTSGTLDDGVNPGSVACGNLGVISGSWNFYTITVPNTALAVIKDFFKATFIYNGGVTAGNGGTVYFDNIQFSVL